MRTSPIFSWSRRAPAQARRPKPGNGVTLFAIDAKRPGITVTPLKTMDQTRKLGEVRVAGVKATAADVVGEVGDGWQCWPP